VGRPNISPRGSGDPKTKSELSLLSSEPLTDPLPALEGPPSPEKVPPRPLVDLFEEEAINGKQGAEEEEKDKEKEEEKLECVCV
jgi:hypothetical protein